MTDTPEKPVSSPESANDIDRDDKGRFKPGQAPYRGGSKPRFIRDFAGHKFEIEELYLSNAAAVFYELIKIIRDPKTTATARVSAIREYNDRALGRPNQSVKVSAQGQDGAVYDNIDTSLLPSDVLRLITQAQVPERKK